MTLWHLDVRDRNVGGPVLPARLVYPAGADTGATLDLLAIQPSVVFLIHGFNVNRGSGQAQLTRLSKDLPIKGNPAFVGLTWPGDSWAGPVSYPLEGNDADDTAAELAKFISWAIPQGTTLSFVTHSMGARVAFETVKALPAGAYPIAQVCVMAAAIDDFSVSERFTYRTETENAARVAVLASERDNVLKWAYPLGDWIQAFLFFWRDEPGSALGYHGPRSSYDGAVPANVEHVQIPDGVKVDHGDYLSDGDPSTKEQRAAAWATLALDGDALKY